MTTSLKHASRLLPWLLVTSLVLTLVGLISASSPAVAAGPCGPPVVNVIACENSLPGADPSTWQVNNTDTNLLGFATAMSINAGETESFKIKSNTANYHVDIFRLGYYQGKGARLIAGNIRPTSTPTQPACVTQPATGLVDCGNWAVTASWAAPSTAVSGVYLAVLNRDDNSGASQVPFVVRNDDSHSDMLVQTSDTTWQAYNTYGGNSLYSGAPAGRAYAVSYNRPFTTSSPNFVWDSEYPMIRFMEANGYDISYTSGLDTDQRPSLLLNHKVFVSSGHDEYWSGGQRAAVEAARAAGVNLAFFSGNEMFWKTRWAPSIDGTTTANRTLVCYKDTHDDKSIDPQGPSMWTGTWRDPRFSPPGDGGKPENALTGQYFAVNLGTTDIQVPYAYSKLRLWRNTAVAALAPGQTTTLAPGTGVLGYEWDEEPDNGFRPAGLFDLSSTTANVPEAFTDYGNTVAAGTRTHHLSLYRAASGALVFGSGTVQWSWGLDNSNPTGRAPDKTMQQATVNLFADMGAQPSSLIAGLTAASASTDTTAPTSVITSPADGSSIADGTRMTVSGTASDTGGGSVAGVEVSTDGGASWHPATGTTSWSYSFVAHGAPSFTLKTRAVDDSGNLETPGTGVKVIAPCPCSIWGPNVTPAITDSGDTSGVEVGMKFTTDTFGVVSGVRFYKGTNNTGTHVGNLWTASGTRLATATFSGESASGWQQVNFSSPVSVNPNTTYVVSYYAPKGHYAQAAGYFYPPPSPPPSGGGVVDAGPLHALRNSGTTTNGVYSYNGSSLFPVSTFGAENYWVDVVFSPTPAPGQVTNVTATAGYASASVNWTAPAGGQVTTYTVTPSIGGTAQTPTVVTGDPAATGTTVTGLTNGTAYTFTVTASNPAGAGAPSSASAPVTPLASLQIVSNGGFEGGLSPWATAGIPAPAASTAKAHTGSGSALLGSVTGTPPLGDSSLSQRVTLPSGSSSLSFWYLPATADTLCSGTACKYDWQEAQLRTTSGTTLASIFKLNSNSLAWTQVTFDTSAYAGQTVVLWFNVHQDGTTPPDNTSMYLDDVTVTGSTPPAPTAPGAPTAVTATASSNTAAVSWTAPANGGSPITGYRITPFIGTTAQTATTITGNPPVTTASISGLANGSAYTFTVAAINAVGTGGDSSASNVVTPSAPTAPGAPTGVTAAPGDSKATVNWTAPASGGSPITGYRITPYLGSTAQTATTITGNPPVATASISGLTNGSAYTFTVAAINAIGTGAESVASAAVTPTGPVAPGAPTGVAATAGSSSATVNWVAPANGGSAITGYTVTPFIGTTAQTPVTVTGTPPATLATVSGLTNGTSYTFKVTATNAIGTGTASAASNAVSPGTAGPIAVDRTVFTDGTGTMTSPALTTTAANELIVAFVSLDGANGAAKQTATVSGAGLTWTLAKRSNGQSGDSEIWTARAANVLTAQTVVATPAATGFHGSLTVVAFQKAGGVGASAAASALTGAPDVVVPGTGAGSWVFAVGNDWDNAVARTPAAGQTIVHQRVDTPAGDTFWVQSTTAANGAAGSVDIRDTAPTADRWNYAAVEITPGA